jgi:hypothetical protein
LNGHVKVKSVKALDKRRAFILTVASNFDNLRQEVRRNRTKSKESSFQSNLRKLNIGLLRVRLRIEASVLISSRHDEASIRNLSDWLLIYWIEYIILQKHLWIEDVIENPFPSIGSLKNNIIWRERIKNFSKFHFTYC